MIDTAFLKELDRFSFMINKRISTVYAGSRRSIKQGRGIDIYDYREYYPGDDIKSVDWKLYARTEKLHIKRFEEEKSLTTHILVDASRSMDYGKPLKYDYASMIALGYAYLVTRENEKFALATYGDTMGDTLYPGKGRMHLSKATKLLEGASLKGRTDFNSCAEAYSASIRSRSLVIVVSDFLEPLSSLRRGIHKIAKKAQELILVQVLDPKEVTLQGFEGDMKLYDMESREVKRVYMSPRFREDYLRALEEHLYGIKKTCDELKAEFYSFDTSRPIFEAFLRMMG
jgi:uncharacterized protein (DUF58 family)